MTDTNKIYDMRSQLKDAQEQLAHMSRLDNVAEIADVWKWNWEKQKDLYNEAGKFLMDNDKPET